jgi:hypothetical protein
MDWRFGADKVITPHMVSALRPEPHARSIVEPQATPCFLLLWNLQPFATPDSLDSILANLPACPLQQRGDAPVAVAPILAGQQNDRLSKSIFVFALCRLVALCAAWLVHQPARPPLTHALVLSMIRRNAPSFRA